LRPSPFHHSFMRLFMQRLPSLPTSPHPGKKASRDHTNRASLVKSTGRRVPRLPGSPKRKSNLCHRGASAEKVIAEINDVVSVWDKENLGANLAPRTAEFPGALRNVRRAAETERVASLIVYHSGNKLGARKPSKIFPAVRDQMAQLI
jgi:hypothetical protein